MSEEKKGMDVGRYRVLLIEDDKVDQLAFRRFVREANLPYDLTVAGSVAEARAFLQPVSTAPDGPGARPSRPFDVVVTDYSLGDGTAFDIVGMVKSTPLIFTTGAGDEAVAVKAMKTGAADYLIKDHERNYLKVLSVTVENAIRRLKAEEQVRKLTLAVEQSPATVVITDPEGSIEYVNPKFTVLTGYTAGEALWNSPRILKSGEQPVEFYREMWDTIKAGREWRGEFHNRRKDGTLFWESASISPLRDRDGSVTHFVAVKEDITERKRIEEEREKLIQELDAFAHTVAHDLKNPLGAVSGFADFILTDRQKMGEKELDECLTAIHEGARKMQSIVDELLLLAGVRKMEVKLEPVDMTVVVAGAWQRMQHMARELSPQIVLPATWRTALGYGPWIEEVWANYLSNGLKYGGRPPRLELGSDERADGRVRFWVRDNGPGLDEAARQRLFTPFTRLHQARATGQGLGLSIVRRILEKLGGEAWVESRPGEGSLFGFTLPGAPRP
jgi:PAS domain S-box-containing protein